MMSIVRLSVLCTLAGSMSLAQLSQTPTFEVASVKRSPPPPPGARVFFGPARGGPGTPDPSQITWTYARLRDLLMTAYDVKEYQINGPGWLSGERYDIVAKVPEHSTSDQVRMMWQNLLAERFGVRLHHELKEFQVEELVIAKGGSKLKETTLDAAALLDPGPPAFDKNRALAGPGYVTTFNMINGEAHTVAQGQPLSKLTTMLGNTLRRPVIDKTGLTGKYDFSLDFRIDLPAIGPAAPTPADNAPDPGPDITAAVEQQLGLRLVAGKAMLDVLVIDKADKVPTDN
jgi:uncharacterized protein (TIGR03435 family)